VIFETAFAFEMLARLSLCEDRSRFMFNTFNFIDAVSIMPLFFRSYIAVKDGFVADASVEEKTLLAIVPIIHLLKLLRRFEKLQLLVSAFELALEALPVLLYTLALIAIFFSEIFYLVEPRENFSDLPTALWFTVVTMTTVGYGDKTPTNAGGHLVASILIIFSALYMAIPIGIVGHAFSQVWGDRDRLLVMQRFRDAFLGGGFTVKSIQDIFNMFDEDGSGELDIEEFSLMLKTMQLHMDPERLCLLYQNLDVEGLGRITLEALIDGLVPKAFAHKFFLSRESRSPTQQTELDAAQIRSMRGSSQCRPIQHFPQRFAAQSTADSTRRSDEKDNKPVADDMSGSASASNDGALFNDSPRHSAKERIRGSAVSLHNVGVMRASAVSFHVGDFGSPPASEGMI